MAPKPSIKYVYDGIYSALHLEALFYWLRWGAIQVPRRKFGED
jgi:hypothetical protein